jgi:hypothetical protein
MTDHEYKGQEGSEDISIGWEDASIGTIPAH